MWEVTTIAGNPYQNGFKDGKGDEALFHLPRGLSMSFRGNLLVADEEEGIIREFNLKTSHVTTFPGKIQSAFSVRENSRGNLFVADHVGHVIWMTNGDGNFKLKAGNLGQRGDFDGISASFFSPRDIEFDSEENL